MSEAINTKAAMKAAVVSVALIGGAWVWMFGLKAATAAPQATAEAQAEQPKPKHEKWKVDQMLEGMGVKNAWDNPNLLGNKQHKSRLVQHEQASAPAQAATDQPAAPEEKPGWFASKWQSLKNWLASWNGNKAPEPAPVAQPAAPVKPAPAPVAKPEVKAEPVTKEAAPEPQKPAQEAKPATVKAEQPKPHKPTPTATESGKGGNTWDAINKQLDAELAK